MTASLSGDQEVHATGLKLSSGRLTKRSRNRGNRSDQDGSAAAAARGPGWDMHLGDCIEGMRGLADQSVDVTITDPPYEDEAHAKGKRQNPGHGQGAEERGKAYVRVVDEEFSFPPITERQRKQSAAEIARVTRSAALVFCQIEAAMLWRRALEAGGLVYRRTIPWVKPDAMPCLHGRWPGQAFEAIVLAMRPGATAPIGGKARYYEVTRERGETRAHATAKPLALMRMLVDDFTEAGDIVLDPFAGSGSTGVACLMLGRRFIGWELCPEYHVVAARRLRGDEAKPRAEQPSLFDLLSQEAP